jgi:xylulokinase
MYFVGLDIGTTNIKALLMNEKTEIIHIAHRPDQMTRDKYGCPVFDAASLWDTALQCLKECVKYAPDGSIAGLSVSSMAEAGVPLGKDGSVLYPVLPWNDRRAESELDSIKEHFSPLELYKKTGQPLHTKYPIGKFLWLKKHEPDVFRSIKTWLSVGDFIVYKLTGEIATDYTQACRTMFYNITDKCWDTDIMDSFGLDHIFPRVFSFGTAIGKIKTDILDLLSIRGDITVSVGAHDHLLALYAVQPGNGEILDSMGTAEVFTGLSSHPALDQKNLDIGTAQGLLDAEHSYWMTSLPSSGASVEWFSKTLSLKEKLTYEDIQTMSDESISHDIIYLPYLNGRGTPHFDPAAKASFLNIGISDGPKELLKAVYEGTSFQTKLILETLDGLNGIRAEKLIAVGGGAKNEAWLQTKANILQKSIETVDVKEMSALGAALCSAKSFGIAFDTDSLPRKTLDPQKNGRDEYYKKKYEEFKRYTGLLYD